MTTQTQTAKKTQQKTQTNVLVPEVVRRHHEKSPMTIGQKVTISERCEPILNGIYKLKGHSTFTVSDILTGPNGKQLFELLGQNAAGNNVNFVVSPKMVRRVKVSAPTHITAERLAINFGRPQFEFKGLAALQSAGKLRRTHPANDAGNS